MVVHQTHNVEDFAALSRLITHLPLSEFEDDVFLLTIHVLYTLFHPKIKRSY